MARSLLATWLIFSCAGAATAQSVDISEAAQPASSFEQLQNRLAPGDTLYVIDASGEETKGRLTRALDATLTLIVDGTRREFAAHDVEQVDRSRRDPVHNGVLIGLGAGAIAGYALGRGTDSPSCPRPGIECGQGAALGVVSGAFWGAIGGWIADALIRTRETVYQAKPRWTP
jgi:hypothetical protein